MIKRRKLGIEVIFLSLPKVSAEESTSNTTLNKIFKAFPLYQQQNSDVHAHHFSTVSLESVSELSKVTRYKFSMQNYIVFLFISNKKRKN